MLPACKTAVRHSARLHKLKACRTWVEAYSNQPMLCAVCVPRQCLSHASSTKYSTATAPALLRTTTPATLVHQHQFCCMLTHSAAIGWAPPACSSPATCTTSPQASCQSTAWPAKGPAASSLCHPLILLEHPTRQSNLCTAPSSMPGWCSLSAGRLWVLRGQQQQQRRLMVAAAVAAVTLRWCRMLLLLGRRLGSCQVWQHMSLWYTCVVLGLCAAFLAWVCG
jgi:hypothetical protein